MSRFAHPAYMLSEGLEYIYSFDDDFDAIEGITRLDTAVNPFAWRRTENETGGGEVSNDST